MDNKGSLNSGNEVVLLNSRTKYRSAHLVGSSPLIDSLTVCKGPDPIFGRVGRAAH